ncbi:MAG: isopentenyl phosphate kinase [Candidatus Bathyarchaeia archaeon]
MNKHKPIICKIGGSVITNKNEELAPKTQEMNRIAQEIRRAEIMNLVIVHGGGSFGHPLAQKYTIKDGFKDVGQLVGFAETHHMMTVLNGLFMDTLIMQGIPAVSITPSSCIITENGRIKCFEDATLRIMLKMGFIPVLYGDAVLDTTLGFTILSGDQIVSHVATRLNAEQIVMGVDVDGLYDADPKLEKNARLFTHLTLEELKKLHGKLGKSNACDVTGGMLGKIAELIPALEQGIPVKIVNASKPNYIYKVLKGEEVEGTLIEKE